MILYIILYTYMYLCIYLYIRLLKYKKSKTRVFSYFRSYLFATPTLITYYKRNFNSDVPY